FGDHFRELRKRVFRVFLILLAGFCICWPFAEELFSLLTLPLLVNMPKGSTFIFTSPPEAFFTYMKIALVAGFFTASPLIFYQVWAFVAPGLYKEEKLYILPIAFFSAFFFTGGGAFCYYVVFPFAFEFFMSYNTGIIQAMPALSETLSFVLKLLIAFGLVFEMPLFAFFLGRMGLLTAGALRRFRRYAVLLLFIVAAILTPPDVVSQLLMAGPLLLLYEVSILIVAAVGKKEPDAEEDDEEDDDEEEDDEDGGRTAGAAS
ncbi:twin-arginine translocase subunit TatC, partial [Desulfovibrio sp. OttesenSCG-928-G11]|nr:twin-arginine translocase subunit TatC [Desulfovibrio sp. OttesenSCG-928-G11]